MDMTVLQEVNQKYLPQGVPPVPRGYKVYANNDGIVITKAPNDKRKNKGRVPAEAPYWVLSTNEQQTEYAWISPNQYGTLEIRENFIRTYLGLEIKIPGSRATAKAPKCSTILRQEYGMTGTPLSLYIQFCKFRKLPVDPKLAERALAEGVS